VTLIGRFWVTPEGPTPKSAQFLVILPRGLQLWLLLRLAALVGLSEPRFTAKRENCRPRHSIKGATNPAPGLTRYTGSKSIVDRSGWLAR
jgi:hypothetical protein